MPRRTRAWPLGHATARAASPSARRKRPKLPALCTEHATICVANKGRAMYVAESKRLTHAGARLMMTTAIAKAGEAGVAICCAIVDAGGHLIALERMDGGRFHTVHSATVKAVTAASNRRPTATKGAAGQDLDVIHALGLTLAAGPERWTAMEGGCLGASISRNTSEGSWPANWRRSSRRNDLADRAPALVSRLHQRRSSIWRLQPSERAGGGRLRCVPGGSLTTLWGTLGIARVRYNHRGVR